MRNLLWPLSLVVLVTGCHTVTLPVAQTASTEFASLNGNRERQIAHNFYEFGAASEVQDLYWRQRDGQRYAKTVDTGAALKHRYIVLPVPEHTAPDGTIIEASEQVVQVVDWIQAVPNRGR